MASPRVHDGWKKSFAAHGPWRRAALGSIPNHAAGTAPNPGPCKAGCEVYDLPLPDSSQTPGGSSGAARRDFRSSGQPCGIDVTLISSEQQQASVISQISDGCRGLSRFAMAMFLDVLEILWHRTVYLETVIRQACVAEPQQPGSQPALAAKSQSPCLTLLACFAVQINWLMQTPQHNPPPTTATDLSRPRRVEGCLLLASDGENHIRLIARVAGRGSPFGMR